ncbi:hypothetical protein AKJ09_09085 [Labilithrix luteola]|uniref:DUF72 domain-containing protein n=1 Tax=Labilithrix luteola TaxID=1391654 RepID=A0A0K1Q9T1_9BACT|nr:DUF72 domain-containing protein [Labilithrix luteola]AKV02422.1 hypothetical protein AKJ09_09085 [Labilithrix luteola]
MATRLHIGARELRGELAAYAKRFDYLEVRGLDAQNLRLAPSTATLKRWRKAVPPQFEFGVVAGPNLSALRPGSALDTELEAMLATATTLEARVLLIQTPPSVTPGKLWRDRLAGVLDRLRSEVTTLVWEPTGLWELDEAAAQAKKWGVTLAVDPARDEVPAGSVSYGRLRAIGGTRAFSTAALERIAAKIGERRDAYVIIETTSALKEGKTLRGLLRGTSSKKRGGLGRLIRPRGAPLNVRDDEQEE